MRRHLWIILAIAIISAAAVFLLWPRGVETIIRNAGAEPMRDVRVLVTGRAYALGDIHPNEVRSVHVKPLGESSITIRYTDAAGTPRSADVDCYIESGYSGSISVDLASGAVTRKAVNIQITPLAHVWIAAASAALILSVAALGFAQVKRRQDRRRAGRCPACGYDLRATPQGGRCPECGRTATPVNSQ
jgi:hypothetical protein